MHSILKKIGLVTTTTVEVPVNRETFIGVLQSRIDAPGLDIADFFSTSRNRYKGIVEANGFRLKRRRRMAEMNIHPARAYGKFVEGDNKLTIHVEVNAFQYIMLLWLFVALFLYLVVMVLLVFGSVKGAPGWAVPFTLLHAMLMFGLPYYMMRRNLHMATSEIRRDLASLFNAKPAL